MTDVQSILMSCKLLQFFCQVAGDGSDVGHDRRAAIGEHLAAELESQFDQLHAQTSRILHCRAMQRYPDSQEAEEGLKCVIELWADVLTTDPDFVRRALVELTAPFAIPRTVRITDRYAS